MTEHLARSNKLHALRSMRFPKPFCEDVSALVLMMTKEIVDHYLQVCYGYGGGEGECEGGGRYLQVYHGEEVRGESGKEGAVIYRYTTGMGEWEGGGHYLQVNHGEEVGGGRVGGRGLLSTGIPWGRGRGRVSGREGAVIYR